MSSPLPCQLFHQLIVQLDQHQMPDTSDQMTGQCTMTRTDLQYGVRGRAGERVYNLPLKIRIDEKILSQGPFGPYVTPTGERIRGHPTSYVRRTMAVRSSVGTYGVAESAKSKRTSTICAEDLVACSRTVSRTTSSPLLRSGAASVSDRPSVNNKRRSPLPHETVSCP